MVQRILRAGIEVQDWKNCHWGSDSHNYYQCLWLIMLASSPSAHRQITGFDLLRPILFAFNHILKQNEDDIQKPQQRKLDKFINQSFPPLTGNICTEPQPSHCFCFGHVDIFILCVQIQILLVFKKMKYYTPHTLLFQMPIKVDFS